MPRPTTRSLALLLTLSAACVDPGYGIPIKVTDMGGSPDTGVADAAPDVVDDVPDLDGVADAGVDAAPDLAEDGAPVLAPLASMTARFGQGLLIPLDISDPDTPPESITVSVVEDACGVVRLYTSDVSEASAFLFVVCGDEARSCPVVVEVSDGDATTRGALSLECVKDTRRIEGLSAGYAHTCVIQEGSLKCWGLNESGQLGDGTADDQPMPTQVVGMGSGVTAVAAGVAHTCAIQRGALKCWGANSDGQLGDGSTVSASTPRQVVGLDSGVTSVAVGAFHTCAVHQGVFKCWGNNRHGELGDGTMVSQAAPTTASTLTASVLASSLGFGYSCVVEQGLKCWGYGTDGQLGAGDTQWRSTPTRVQGAWVDAVDVLAAGLGHACASSGGAVYCWGRGGQGQLGEGAILDSSSPVAVGGLSGVTQLAVGGGQDPTSGHTCAITGGALKCWGSDRLQQLGAMDDLFDQRALSPLQVPGLDNGVERVVAGGAHTCALHQGVLKCWGDNQLGQAVGSNGVVDFGVVSLPMPVYIP